MNDMREDSNIISLSLGDAREFVLTSNDDIEQQRVVLEDGDLFVLGPRTNASLKHAVLPVKERIIERHGAVASALCCKTSKHSSLELMSWQRSLSQSVASNVLARRKPTPSQRPESQKKCRK
jgi:2OG-Fe(II) oxygenase superfamily